MARFDFKTFATSFLSEQKSRMLERERSEEQDRSRRLQNEEFERKFRMQQEAINQRQEREFEFRGKLEGAKTESRQIQIINKERRASELKVNDLFGQIDKLNPAALRKWAKDIGFPTGLTKSQIKEISERSILATEDPFGTADRALTGINQYVSISDDLNNSKENAIKNLSEIVKRFDDKGNETDEWKKQSVKVEEMFSQGDNEGLIALAGNIRKTKDFDVSNRRSINEQITTLRRSMSDVSGAAKFQLGQDALIDKQVRKSILKSKLMESTFRKQNFDDLDFNIEIIGGRPIINQLTATKDGKSFPIETTGALQRKVESLNREMDSNLKDGRPHPLNARKINETNNVRASIQSSTNDELDRIKENIIFLENKREELRGVGSIKKIQPSSIRKPKEPTLSQINNEISRIHDASRFPDDIFDKIDFTKLRNGDFSNLFTILPGWQNLQGTETFNKLIQELFKRKRTR